MGLVYFINVVVALSVLGYHTSSACDSNKIQACSQGTMDLNNMGMSFGSVDMTPVCGALNTVITCVQAELADCPSELQDMVRDFNEVLGRIQDQCKDPSSIDASKIMDCPMEEMGKCYQRAQPQTSTASEMCLSIGRMSNCLSDFTDGCPSNFLNNIMSLQEPAFSMAKKSCERQGHGTGAAASLHQLVLIPFLTSLVAVVGRYLM